MKKLLQSGNIVSVLFAIAANAFVSTSENLPDIRFISDQYSTLLNPATYAFAIWTIIYMGIFIFVLYQARDFFSSDKNNILPWQLSGWFMLANIMNGIWTYVFVSGYLLFSVIIILTLLASLLLLLWRLRIAIYDAFLSTILLVWWPLMLYTGWVLVASVANTASYLTSVGILLSPFVAAAIILALAVVLSILLWQRNVRMLVLASTWGIAAIAVAQYGSTPEVWMTASAVTILLILQVIIHGYKNRTTNPFYKLLYK